VKRWAAWTGRQACMHAKLRNEQRSGMNGRGGCSPVPVGQEDSQVRLEGSCCRRRCQPQFAAARRIFLKHGTRPSNVMSGARFVAPRASSPTPRVLPPYYIPITHYTNARCRRDRYIGRFRDAIPLPLVKFVFEPTRLAGMSARLSPDRPIRRLVARLANGETSSRNEDCKLESAKSSKLTVN